MAFALFVSFSSLAESPAPVAPPIVEPAARVLPVLAEHGMVVAQEGTAARIGVDILRRGGNAVDAAVAVGFALAVTLPRAGNLGGGGFMLVYLASDEADRGDRLSRVGTGGYDPRCLPRRFGRAVPQKSRDSGLAVGVPGTVAGLTLALAALWFRQVLAGRARRARRAPRPRGDHGRGRSRRFAG